MVYKLLVVGRGARVLKYFQALGTSVVLAYQAEPGMCAAVGYFLAA